MSDGATASGVRAPRSAPPKLELRNITVARTSASGERVIAARDVSLQVDTGEFVCLLGPSGCGKTSILQILAGLERPAGGQALLDGTPISRPGPDRAVLFQEPALFPWLSVRGNIELALELEGVPSPERREWAERWIAGVHLERWADAQPHELSAGMRQRAALARALSTDPDVLLGDEPFGALDAQARELMQNELQRVWVAAGGRKTFVFVTHNVREAVVLADRVFVMSAAPGRLLEEFRIHTPRPRDLDDVLVTRVVSEIHELLMQEVDESVAREMAR
jgi:NitT/TauT family transport system ATP-binding protein